MLRGVVTPERFAQGMTFAEYVAYAGSPENLAREAGWWLGTERKDLSGRDTPFFRVWTSTAIDEMLSALYERLVVGAPS
jgi:hypothetical protein